MSLCAQRANCQGDRKSRCQRDAGELEKNNPKLLAGYVRGPRTAVDWSARERMPSGVPEDTEWWLEGSRKQGRRT